MASPAAAPRRRWVWLGLLPALALAGFFAVRLMLQPERLSAFLLRQASTATGLELALERPADIGFWPDLHLELSGLVARAPGVADPVLRAQAVEVALPWSALGAETLQIESLRLTAPQLDVAAARQWAESRAPTQRTATPQLPQIDAAVEVDAGRIEGDGWGVEALHLRLASLREGEPTTLAASGSFTRGATSLPFDLRMATTPRLDGGTLRLDPLSIEVVDPGARTVQLQLAGNFAWSESATAMKFDGSFASWPDDWPALPFPSAEQPAAREVRLRFEYQGARLPQGRAAFSLSRGEDSIAGDLQLGDLATWLAAPQVTSLPPIAGTMSASRLRFGAIEVSGVKLRIEDDPVIDDNAKR